jgi:hypothetical protein
MGRDIEKKIEKKKKKRKKKKKEKKKGERTQKKVFLTLSFSLAFCPGQRGCAAEEASAKSNVSFQ